ncbi:MAG: hypothetical protein C3F08_09715 [Candidatus Methylomirabilota bacterium]|nr:MAG: hypothetical protein C3F08_09715 [candidate division NC10 bacterium]
MLWCKQQQTAFPFFRSATGSLIVGAIVVGCTGAPQVTHSGFLRDYSLLRPDPAVEGAMTWRAPVEILKQYKQFIIEPVVVHFAPNAKGTAIDPAELKKLTDYFHDQLAKAVSETGRYQVVTAPGPGVARVRIAITDISKTAPLANIHPATKLTGIGLGGAAMEGEMVDSVSGERLGAAVDSESGARLGITAGLQTYGHAKQVIDRWAARFVTRLDALHGYTKR